MASVIEHFAITESTTYEKNIKFYKELLNDEKESPQDLDYWIDYVNKFDVGHKIPLYDQ